MSRQRHSVVVTGMGAVTPLGGNWPETWRRMVAGDSGIGPWPFFDASTYPASICGAVDDGERAPEGLSPREASRLARPARMGVRAAQEAIESAGLPSTEDDPRRGVFMGHSVGRPSLDRLQPLLDGTTIPALAPRQTLEQEPNVALNLIARLVGATGPVIGVSTACAASAHAVGEAMRAIEDGDVDIAVAGGFDSLTSWIDLLGFGLLGALTPSWNDEPDRASRPFDLDRDGFVIGEGAAVVVLESEAHARARHATVLGRIDGYGASLNAFRITDSPPDGSGAIECMQAAIGDAGWSPDWIDLVVAHGTSTPGNDSAETAAIRHVLGGRSDQVLVTAPKSSVGHLTAASASLGLLVALQSISEGRTPGTRNIDTPDPGCDLDYLSGGLREQHVERALVDAFAFGGTNACLAVSGASSRPRRKP